ncbi:MAG: alpha/beta fold hydrolase [Alphaproteobacteria bacterium]|nr:alpha/beta fold hydrolase [Alphaproteobacteria bacterium]
MDKKLFFLDGPDGDIAAFYRGPKELGAGEFPVVILSHGYGANTTMAESARLFYNTLIHFTGHGIGGLMFDFTGHGLSDGAFHDMTPNSRIQDLSTVINWVQARHTGAVFLLGLSMGGAISIHMAQKYQEKLAGLITWSTVPSLDPDSLSSHWYLKNSDEASVYFTGKNFQSERPDLSVGAAYADIAIPKLQVQGDGDYPHFAEEFFQSAQEPKTYVNIPGGDHTFTDKKNREHVLRTTSEWVLKHAKVD